MCKALLTLALLVLASPAWATWTRVGTFAVGNDTTQDTSLVVATSAALEAGNVGICVIASDEGGAGTTDGDNGEVVSVVDAAGNTWIEAIEFCNMQTSTINNGACVAVWYTRAATQLNSGANITITLLDVATDPRKALTCDEWTISGNDVSIAAGKNGAPYDAANVGSLTDATGISIAHLFIRASACESNNTGYGADADYTGFDGSTTTSTANSGTSTTSMGARGESRIATEATSAASDPDYPSSAGTADCASVMIALDEQTITPAGGTRASGMPYPARPLRFGSATSDRVVLPSNSAFNTKASWSAGFLLYTTTLTLTRAIIAKGNDSGTEGWFLYQPDASGNLAVFIAAATTAMEYKTTTTPLKTGRWQFVAVQFDFAAAATQRAKIYVSSDLLSPLVAATIAVTTEPSGGQSDDSGQTLTIANYGTNVVAFQGSIALAFVSPSTTLTLAELQEWQRNPLLPPRGCQGLWINGDNGMGLVMDRSGGSNEGTITGAIPVEPVFLSFMPNRRLRAPRIAAAAAAELLNRLLMGVGR